MRLRLSVSSRQRIQWDNGGSFPRPDVPQYLHYANSTQEGQMHVAAGGVHRVKYELQKAGRRGSSTNERELGSERGRRDMHSKQHRPVIPASVCPASSLVPSILWLRLCRSGYFIRS